MSYKPGPSYYIPANGHWLDPRSDHLHQGIDWAAPEGTPIK
jgi:murein DD-endopeptidase MepM/ murein hydrolase activator NlpD